MLTGARTLILESLKQAVTFMAKQDKRNYWLSDDGLNERFRRIGIHNRNPSSSLDMFDYTADTKAMLSSAATSGGDEWIEVRHGHASIDGSAHPDSAIVAVPQLDDVRGG